MTEETPKDDPSKLIKPPKPGFFAQLRNNFLTGVVVAAPLGITFWLLYLFITGPVADLDGFVKGILPDDFRPTYILENMWGFGVIVAIIALIILGSLAKNFIGRSLINFGESVLDSVPVVRNLYGFFKNVFEMALQQSERSFKEVALVQYPRKGIWTLGFVVTDTKGEVKHKIEENTEGPFVSLFVPTTPNPTSGFLLFTPRRDVQVLSMTVEEGAKFIFSAGLVTPHYDPEEAVAKLEALAAAELENPTTSERIKSVLPFQLGRKKEDKAANSD